MTAIAQDLNDNSNVESVRKNFPMRVQIGAPHPPPLCLRLFPDEPIVRDLNDNLNVQSLHRNFPMRVQELIDAEGDRICPTCAWPCLLQTPLPHTMLTTKPNHINLHECGWGIRWGIRRGSKGDPVLSQGILFYGMLGNNTSGQGDPIRELTLSIILLK